MTKGEAICELYGLVADINEEEVADHIKSGVSLQDWTNAWRCRAKDVLRVLEDTTDTPQTENPCDGCVCDDGKHLMYCMNCKGIAWKTEPPKVADTSQTDCDRYAVVNDEGERVYNCIGCHTDCGWK